MPTRSLCNSDDRCQRQKQEGAVGAAACKMRVPSKARSRCREPQPEYISGKIIFNISNKPDLRVWLICFFTGRAVTGNGIRCCRLTASRSDSKSAKHKKAIQRSSRRTGGNLQLFCVQPTSLGLLGASSPCLQQRRPLPAAETGRSCWGSGLQDASAVYGTKQTQGAATRRLPRFESSGDLAVLNTQHLLRNPVCALKAPPGLSCPTGTAVLSGTLLCVQKSTYPPDNHFIKAIEPTVPDFTLHRKQIHCRILTFMLQYL